MEVLDGCRFEAVDVDRVEGGVGVLDALQVFLAAERDAGGRDLGRSGFLGRLGRRTAHEAIGHHHVFSVMLAMNTVGFRRRRRGFADAGKKIGCVYGSCFASILGAVEIVELSLELAHADECCSRFDALFSRVDMHLERSAEQSIVHLVQGQSLWCLNDGGQCVQLDSR